MIILKENLNLVELNCALLQNSTWNDGFTDVSSVYNCIIYDQYLARINISMKLFNVFPQKFKRFVGVQTASPYHAMYTHQSRDKSVRKYLFLRVLCRHHARSESILTKK